MGGGGLSSGWSSRLVGVSCCSVQGIDRPFDGFIVVGGGLGRG